MKTSLLLSLGAVGSHARLHPRAIVAFGPSGTCPITTIQLQPVVYCEYFPYSTIVDPFRISQSLTVSNAPTSLCTSTYLTTTILPNFEFTTTTSAPPTFSSTDIGSRPLLSTSVPTPTTSFSPTDLSIGQGLPSGIVNSLPNDRFIFLAFTNAPRPTAGIRKRGELSIRQGADPMVSPIALVNLGVGLPGGRNQDDCDDSSPLLLQAGSLIQYSMAVAKQQSQTAADLGFLTNPTKPVNVTFSLMDGFLQWDSTDLGTATFYDCAGVFVASFAGSIAGCTEILIGAIAGQICVDRVRQTAVPNPAFVAPVTALLSTSKTTLSVPTSSPVAMSTTTNSIESSLTSINPTSSSSVSFVSISGSPVASSSMTTTESTLTSSMLSATSTSMTSTGSAIVVTSQFSTSTQTSSSTDRATTTTTTTASMTSTVNSASAITSSMASTPSSSTSRSSFPSQSTSSTNDLSTGSSSTADSTTSTTPTTTTTTMTTTTTSTTTTTTTTSTSASPSPSVNQACGAVDPYTSVNGKRFQNNCSRLYFGNDLYAYTSATTYTSCAEACSVESRCVAFDFNQSAMSCGLLDNTRYGTYSDPSWVSGTLIAS